MEKRTTYSASII